MLAAPPPNATSYSKSSCPSAYCDAHDTGLTQKIIELNEQTPHLANEPRCIVGKCQAQKEQTASVGVSGKIHLFERSLFHPRVSIIMPPA